MPEVPLPAQLSPSMLPATEPSPGERETGGPSLERLLRDLEHRRRRPARDRRPHWLTAFIDRAADLFDPAGGVGRVGCECRPTPAGWAVSLYLGGEEVVGGAEDGRTRPADFRFDLLALAGLFSTVLEMTFEAAPDTSAATAVTVCGLIADQPVTLTVHALPPAEAGAGFRRFPNGRREVRG